MATKTKKRTATQLAADGFAAIVEKLGMAEAIRFVQLFDPGSGDYTRERGQWLDQLSREQIANLMRKTRNKPSAGKRGKL